jgi:superfamily I DNA/RNA helicase/CRISPR/Cas system-associated exonuclease Cas4 (RecB family)
MVQQQLLDALLLPAYVTPQSNQASGAVRDDESQDLAARHSGSPFLLQAGPGTGKTRTLVKRVAWLLENGADPSSILVLTFSNKAANELSERIAAKSSSAASAMWIGTFHSFGLDILRRFYERLGLPPSPRLVDRTEAVELLEDELPRLPLKHFRNLWDPTIDLADMLSAISRAKDEVADAAEYRALCESMLAKVGAEEDAVKQAEKCREVALLYEVYERQLKEEKAVDFGDLLTIPVRLIETDAEVRDAVRSRHRHILVDEYQDVNHASVRLLKGLAGSGENLWVVGDARQSIYRFRGAASTNIAQFKDAFPGAVTRPLELNYRSFGEIIKTFSAFSSGMKASEGALPLKLSAFRGIGNQTPEFRVVKDPADEASAVAAAIQELRGTGTCYQNQAVLCASNVRLNAIADGLEERGIPVLHLGSLFERSEIKDLLALISLLVDVRAGGLVRLAALPAFALPIQDVAKVIEYAASNGISPSAWKTLSEKISGLSSQSEAVFSRIGKLFEGIERGISVWRLLAALVIERLGLARQIAIAGDLPARMRGLSYWQFLNFCRKQPAKAGFPTQRLLDRVRRLVLLAEDRGLQQMPAAAGGIDAVRLLTIHGSKGLEFEAVHIPGMVASGLPRNNRPPRCLPPDGLIRAFKDKSGLEAVKAGHEEEEECVFFVALSRARDRLFLYAASQQSDGKTRNASRFIAPLGATVQKRATPPLLPGPNKPEEILGVTWEKKARWSEREMSTFDRCPRRFFYTHVLRTHGKRNDAPFLKMHNVVHEVVSWLKEHHELTEPTEAAIEEQFQGAWLSKGAIDHGYADDYRQIARRMVSFLAKLRAADARRKVAPITLPWGDFEVTVTPDSVAEAVDGCVKVRRVKSGKPRADEFGDIEYTFLLMAVEKEYGKAAKVEVAYLTSESTSPLQITPAKVESRKEKIDGMIRDIAGGKYPAAPDSRDCPRCPNFFICGPVPTGPLLIKS